jgi:hypothetical protein
MEPVTPPGWTRLAMKSKFGAGRDFAVLDAAGAQVYFVDGKIGAPSRSPTSRRLSTKPDDIGD